jgi:lipid-A-disaccharide synthase
MAGTSMMNAEPCILFTAFEPSGDEHAAAVILELRRLMPAARIVALGGERMREAGAELIERTTDQAAMLGGSITKVREQLALRRRFRAWLRDNPVSVHVPTDSPAANWWFCKAVKKQTRRSGVDRPAGPKVVHFVAPQVWAWAPWRVSRLRKWSDMVLCVLPFEPQWFAGRDVTAQFVGHPIFDMDLDDESLRWEGVSYPTGQPRMALLPGSRPGEIEANWPVMLEVFRRLQQRFPRIHGLVAATNLAAADHVRRLTQRTPEHLGVVVSQPDAVLRWCDLVLTVSGTATLHVTRHRKPMAVLFRVKPLQWHALGRWLVRTRTFTLPNLIALGGPAPDGQAHIVREFVPFTGGPAQCQPIVEELSALIEDGGRRQHQIEALESVAHQFHGRHAGSEAAAHIARIAQS